MASLYKLYLRREALEFLQALPRKRRLEIWDVLEMLEGSPGTEGDFKEFDDSERPVEVLIIGRYSIVFWVDHAVCEVKVIEVALADR